MNDGGDVDGGDAVGWRGMRPRTGLQPDSRTGLEEKTLQLTAMLEAAGFPISTLDELGFYSHKSLITDGVDQDTPHFKDMLTPEQYEEKTEYVNRQHGPSEREKAPYRRELDSSAEAGERHTRIFERMGILPLRVYSENGIERVLIGIRRPDFFENHDQLAMAGDITQQLQQYIDAFSVHFEDDFRSRVLARQLDLDGAEDIQAQYVLLSKMDFSQATAMVLDHSKRKTYCGTIDTTDEGRKAHYHAMGEALLEGASDTHYEPYGEKSARIRFRVDGLLEEKIIPRSVLNRLIGVVKVDAHGMKVAEKRAPQDGVIIFGPEHGVEKDDMRLAAEKPFLGYNLRCSTMPTIEGEKAVLRLLNLNQDFDFENLGLEQEVHDGMLRLLDNPDGLILVTGPTGCGKTTTLYSALEYLNQSTRNICTIEDPVEIIRKGLNQTNVNPDAKLTFETYLKYCLRQDPNVILVGEIRDAATAMATLQAVKTGHLVLSTMHTMTSTSIMERLKDMTDMTDLQSYLRGSLAQRLVRKICPHCVAPEKYNAREELTRLFQKDPGFDVYLKRPKQDVPDYKRTEQKCGHCGDRGYRGRLPITELWVVDDTAAKMIGSRKTNAAAYARVAYEAGMIPMAISGLKRILAGVTTLSEVRREVPEDQFKRWAKESIDVLKQYKPAT